jgi:L-Ala-D/L-Glu epimerase
MKIQRIDQYPVKYHLQKEGWSQDDKHHNYKFWPSEIQNIIIVIHTTGGLVGIGEAPVLHWYYGNTLEHNRRILQLYEEDVKGEDPTNLARIHSLIEKSVGYGAPGSKASLDALDMALLDIAGRAESLPVHQLLGGAYQTEFDLQTNLYLDTADAMAEKGAEYVQMGYKGLKIKCGLEVEEKGWSLANAGRDLEKLKRTLDTVPDTIAVDGDFNQSWGSAIRTIQMVKAHSLERYQNLGLEQPIKFQDLEGASMIASELSLPLILDETIFSQEMLIEVIRRKAAHRIVVKPPRLGGLVESRKSIIIAEAAGINVSVDGGPYSKIGDTALCHLAATVKEPYPVDCEFHTWLRENPVKSGGVTLEAGVAKISQRPGLDIELDFDAIEQMRIR